MYYGYWPNIIVCIVLNTLNLCALDISPIIHQKCSLYEFYYIIYIYLFLCNCVEHSVDISGHAFGITTNIYICSLRYHVPYLWSLETQTDKKSFNSNKKKRLNNVKMLLTSRLFLHTFWLILCWTYSLAGPSREKATTNSDIAPVSTKWLSSSS